MTFRFLFWICIRRRLIYLGAISILNLVKTQTRINITLDLNSEYDSYSYLAGLFYTPFPTGLLIVDLQLFQEKESIVSEQKWAIMCSGTRLKSLNDKTSICSKLS